MFTPFHSYVRVLSARYGRSERELDTFTGLRRARLIVGI